VSDTQCPSCMLDTVLCELLQQVDVERMMMAYDSDDSELMPKVFAIDDNDDDVDLAVPPTSGQEYLKRVMSVSLLMLMFLLQVKCYMYEDYLLR